MSEKLEQSLEFNISEDLLDEIQHNIEHIIKTFDVPESNKMEVIRQINYIYSRSKYLSYTDELTGLQNRRSFDSAIEKEFLRAKRYKNKLTVAMFDIDFFKNVNDSYGHQCGDYILQQIASSALQTFRKTDMIFRVGGEEFFVILTETDIKQSAIPLERFRKTIATLGCEYQGEEISVTVSIGACQLTDEYKSVEEFISAIDKNLYLAKNSGRNNTIF